MQQICVNVSVIDDSTLEDDEIFTVSLQVANAAVSIHIRQTTITIVDNDSITLALTTNQTALVESVGVVEVCVEMTGVTEKIISYQLEVTPLEGQYIAKWSFGENWIYWDFSFQLCWDLIFTLPLPP